MKGLNSRVVNAGLTGHAKDMLKTSTHLKIQGVFLAHTIFFSRGTPEEKMHMAASQIGMFLMTAGMKSGWRQAFWQSALALAPHLPDLGRGMVQGYRGVLQARTMASVPFSYSTLNMDQAYSSMQYANSRMQDSYSVMGGEAAYMAARYMQR